MADPFEPVLGSLIIAAESGYLINMLYFRSFVFNYHLEGFKRAREFIPAEFPPREVLFVHNLVLIVKL